MTDLISRQAAIDIASGYCHPANIAKELANLPSAQPEMNKGKWMHDKDDDIISGYCSCCGWTSIICEEDVAGMPFCPNCGADMRGEE